MLAVIIRLLGLGKLAAAAPAPKALTPALTEAEYLKRRGLGGRCRLLRWQGRTGGVRPADIRRPR